MRTARPAPLLAVATAMAATAAVAGALASCSSGPAGRSGAPVTSAGAATTTAPPRSTSTSASLPATTANCTNASVVDSWPLSRRAAQLVAVPVLSAGPGALRVALSRGAGAVLLLGAMPPAAELASNLKPAADEPPGSAPLVMVDQEGGGVQRLGADVQSIPWPRQMAASMSVPRVQALAAGLARQMAALRVGVDLAPVLDLDAGATLSARDPDGPRSFSADPSTASAYGVAFAKGLQQGGVLPVVKHFPGLGGASGNTDYGPASTPPLSALEAAGLIPFERAVSAGLPAVMVSNASVPGLTTRPASVSAAVISGLLRGRLHFGGLVMTDSLTAGALSAAGYDVPSGAVASIAAGADMVLFGSTLTEADTAALAPAPLAAQTDAIISAIVRAVAAGRLPTARLDAAVLHVLGAKRVALCPAPAR